MKKIGIFIYNGMLDYQISLAGQLLNLNDDIEVVTLSNEEGVIEGLSGLKFVSDKTLKEIEYSEFDGIIIPGGWENSYSKELEEMIKYLKENNKIIAGICGAGTVYLARAGVLESLEYTTPIKSWNEKVSKLFDLDNDPFNRSNCLDYDVVRDKNVITANSDFFIDFALEICDALELFDSAEEKREIRNKFK